MIHAPLYEGLRALAAGDGLRFHLPGHKGRPQGSLLDAALAIDFTEIPATGNLYGEGGLIQQAEALAARYWGAGDCFFLTCGATQGIKAALAAFCGQGAAVALDRNSHQSALDACALLDLHPAWVWPAFDAQTGLSGDIDPGTLADTLSRSGAKAALVTSPTYYGTLLDIPALAAAAHSRGAALIVDAAHGSHLRACGVDDPMAQGADGVIYSAHKTLTAMGQGALLLTAAAHREKRALVRAMTALFGTTSPSYPVMASLDLARARLEADSQAWPRTAELCRKIADAIAALGFRVLSPRGGSDPCRLTVDTAHRGLSGFEAAGHMRRQGIEPEMADNRHVVLIVTPSDSADDLSAVHRAFEAMPHGPAIRPNRSQPPRPQAALSPRQARFAPSAARPLGRCAGYIAAHSVAPYPPGVPVVACGEVMCEKAIEYLLQKGYNVSDTLYVIQP